MEAGISGQRIVSRGKTVPVFLSKSAYLLILLLISVNFFHFTPISFLTNNDICLVIFMLWLVAGHFLFRPVEEYASITFKSYYWTIALIGAGILISFVPARVLFGQSFLTSFIASRVMLCLLALPVIGMIRPDMKDLERAIVSFAIILMAFSILDAIGIPVVDRSFFLNEEKPNQMLIDEDSYVMLLPGFQWVGIALFFYLYRLVRHVSVRNVLGSVFFLSSVYLLQNRTMLFACGLAIAYTLFSMKGEDRRQTYIIKLSAVLVILAAVALTVPQWIKLFSETAMQLGDDDYNRILAYNYFLFEACPSLVYYLTGTGFISANASSIMKDLMSAGIYNSDVGFVGFWNYYGILPVIAFSAVTIKGLFGKTSLFVKFNSLLILVGSLTIACFDTMDKILWLCLFIYFVHERFLARRKKGLTVMSNEKMTVA